jgi:hypothetical protein
MIPAFGRPEIIRPAEKNKLYPSLPLPAKDQGHRDLGIGLQNSEVFTNCQNKPRLWPS